MSTVTRWGCEGCGQLAQKTSTNQRWVIRHHDRCPDRPGDLEDVGPVTSVNDPDNALYRRDGRR